MVKVCWGSQAECPGSVGQLRLRVFGKATWRRSDLLENASVQQSWATWHQGKQRYKDISTAVPPARAWHNTALHFHKDLGLVMLLTSSTRLKPFWPLLQAKIKKKETEFKVVLSDTWLISTYVNHTPFRHPVPMGPVVTGTSTFIISILNPTTKELSTQWKHFCAACPVILLQPDSAVVQPRCAVIFRGTRLLFFSLPVVSVLQLI